MIIVPNSVHKYTAGKEQSVLKLQQVGQQGPLGLKAQNFQLPKIIYNII